MKRMIMTFLFACLLSCFFSVHANDYLSYKSTKKMVDSLIARHPDLVSKVIYGQSVEGRDLYAVKISDNVQQDENEPEVSFDGATHGNEYVGGEMGILLLKELVDGYGSDPRITNLVDTREIWIYPFINPDGRSSVKRVNANGIDLNRDWGYMWDGRGNSPEPFSQPETRAAAEWFLSHQFTISQTSHDPFEIISWAWAYKKASPEDAPFLDHLAKNFAQLSGYYDYYQWRENRYQMCGDMTDYYFGTHGTMAFIVEVCSDKKPPADTIPEIWARNREPMLYLIEQAGRGVHGMVTDAESGKPVRAIIWLKQESTDYWPFYNDPLTGDFHRYALPGTYSLTVTADGYQSRTIHDISVSEDRPAEVSLPLTPLPGSMTHAYKVITAVIPGCNPEDENMTPWALGRPDSRSYSLGKGGYLVIDMGRTISNSAGLDFEVVEGDRSPEGYKIELSAHWNGPWSRSKTGRGTSWFDMDEMNTSSFRYIRITDDNDGIRDAANAGFDLDAIRSH